MSVMVRAEITADEWIALRQLALAKRTPIQRLVADALRTSRVTRQAFQAKEDTK